MNDPLSTTVLRPIFVHPSVLPDIKRCPGFKPASTMERLETGEIGKLNGAQVHVTVDLLGGAKISGLRYG